MIILIIVSCIMWYAIGIVSFIYWLTKDYDFTTHPGDICACIVSGLIVSGLIGPFSFILGWMLCSNVSEKSNF